MNKDYNSQIANWDLQLNKNENELVDGNKLLSETLSLILFLANKTKIDSP